MPIPVAALLLLIALPLAWGQGGDDGEGGEACRDELLREAGPKNSENQIREDLVLPNTVIANQFTSFRSAASREMGRTLWNFVRNPDSFDDFSAWATDYLEAPDLLFEIGFADSPGPGVRERGAGYSEDPMAQIAITEFDDLLQKALALVGEINELKATGYKNFPQVADEDGHLFNSFESWAITRTDKMEELKKVFKTMERVYYTNYDIFLEFQERADNIVRHIGLLMGARQEIYQFLLSPEVPQRLQYSLEGTLLPLIRLRIDQLNEAFQERHKVYSEMAEKIIDQKSRMTFLSEILSQLDV